MKNKTQKWNEAYKEADFETATAAKVLSENIHLLPIENKGSYIALDLACGRAGNAQVLSKLGFQVEAIDISPVLIESLREYVSAENLNIKCTLRDVESNESHGGLPDRQYDVIIVSYFLNRELFPKIKAALKPNGLLFYQTWSQLKVNEAGPNNPNFRLASGELLELCSGLKPLVYIENGLDGDPTKGLRNEAMIIAKKI